MRPLLAALGGVVLVFAVAAPLGAQADTVKKDTASLPGVRVTAEKRNITSTIREGFDDRRKLGLGTFFDSTDVRKFDGAGLAALLRGAKGLKVMEYRDASAPMASAELRVASSVYQGPDGGACWSSVILDNVTIYRSGRMGRPPNLRLDFNITGLERVEFYRGASQAPMSVASIADCGVLVLWTRRRS
jgi:hypothetical protein